MQPPETLRGTRVLLRRPTPTDAEAIFACTSDPDVVRYMDWSLQTDAAQVESGLERSAQRWEDGVEFQWVIEAHDRQGPIGTVACRVRGHSPDFGYFLRKSSWGQGFAHEAAGLLLSWLKDQPGVLRIWASVDAENLRSIALLEKLGLQREGILRMATYRPNIGGLPRDTMILAYCKDEP